MKQLLFTVAAALVIAAPVSAQWVRQKQDPPPRQVTQGVGIDQRLEAQVPLDLRFRDEHGRDVALGEYFGKRPVILALVYYECPMLCNQILNGLTQTLNVMSLDAGRDFDVVAVSFDPREGTPLARTKKLAYVSKYGRQGADEGWHFLTGSQESIAALTSTVGFRYRWDDVSRQWAHGAGIVVLTPGGVVSRYFYGIEYGVRDVRLGLVEASQNRIGNLADQVMLLCFQYDPMAGRYGAVAINSIRVAGVLTVAALGTFILLMLRRERRSVPRNV
ncbi:MAG: SCO family protein [Acidobacteria bacterium]|nr:SCO family protein [Acidobacteriota bacterium]